MEALRVLSGLLVAWILPAEKFSSPFQFMNDPCIEQYNNGERDKAVRGQLEVLKDGDHEEVVVVVCAKVAIEAEGPKYVEVTRNGHHGKDSCGDPGVRHWAYGRYLEGEPNCDKSVNGHAHNEPWREISWGQVDEGHYGTSCGWRMLEFKAGHEPDPHFEAAEPKDSHIRAGQSQEVEVDGCIGHSGPHKHYYGQDVSDGTKDNQYREYVLLKTGSYVDIQGPPWIVGWWCGGIGIIQHGWGVCWKVGAYHLCGSHGWVYLQERMIDRFKTLCDLRSERSRM